MIVKQGVWKLLLGALLAAHAGAAHALDIDRIEIRSQLGQPLLAEIPIVSATPEELQALQAQLAAPVTFARVGLPRPQGVVADLRFAVVRDARGGAVIRVSSTQPVEQDFLTFLIQLDWGQGRMVREYSLSLAAPSTLAAPIPPPIRSATTAPSNRIVRAPEPVPALDLPLPAPAGETAPIDLASAAPPATDDARAAALRAQPIPLASAPARSSPMPSPPLAPKPAASRPAAAVAATPQPVPAKPSPPRSVPTRPAADPPESKPAAPRPAPKPERAAPAPRTIPPPAVAVAAKIQAAAQPAAGEYGPVQAGETLSRIASGVAGEDHTLDQTMLALLRANPEAFGHGNINLLRRGAVLRLPQAAELSQYSAAQAAVLVSEQIVQWREKRFPAVQPLAPAEAPAPTVAAVAEAPRMAPPRLEISPAVGSEPSTGAQSGVEGTAAGSELRPQARLVEAARAAQVEELQARVAELQVLREQQQTLIAMQNSALAERPATDGLPWWWVVLALAAALAVFLLGWALARKRAPAQSSRTHFDRTAPKAADAAPSDASSPASSGTATDDALPLPGSPGWHAGDEKDPGRA